MGKSVGLVVVLLSLYPALSLSRPESFGQHTSSPKPCKICKMVPSSANWPLFAEWSKLNTTLEGSLLAPSPPAIVCDPSRRSTYDKSACDAVGKKWFDHSFHNDDPVSLHAPNWQKDACLPTAVYNGTVGRVCSTNPFPRFVVNATNAQQVVQAIKFARRKGVRLSIKGTGHDYLGKSTSPGLSIWTHNIKGIDILPSFKSSSCSQCTTFPAVRIAAGEVWGDVYAETKKHKVLPVGGAANTVGIGGYLLNGGHSQISARYGLAADNVLEMELVTPNGQFLVANEHLNQDLFWAMRGGGGSSFGVLLSATVKTHQEFPISSFLITFLSTKEEARKNGNKNFFDLIAYMHKSMPLLSDAHLSGYTFMGPKASASNGHPPPGADPSDLINGRQYFFFSGQGLGKTEKEVKDLLRPLWNRLNTTHGIESSVTVSPQASIFSIIGPGSEQGSSYLTPGLNLLGAGWLWDKKALVDEKRVISTMKALQPNVVAGAMVSGPGVRNAANPDAISVTPAWRRTYLHVTTGVSWPYRNKSEHKAAKKLNDDILTKTLIAHAPDMGAYMNEGNIDTPNFQQAFWGSNYARLLKIKRKHDPDNVFICRSCVGSEGWQFRSNGEICKNAS